MTNDEKIEAYTMLLNGHTMQEISDQFGVSKQRIQQLFPNAEKRYEDDHCIYPNLAMWQRDNHVSIKTLAEHLGASSQQTVRWLRGEYFPTKKIIDKILALTGMTYEEAFFEEG